MQENVNVSSVRYMLLGAHWRLLFAHPTCLPPEAALPQRMRALSSASSSPPPTMERPLRAQVREQPSVPNR
jgi:hypothetical protein